MNRYMKIINKHLMVDDEIDLAFNVKELTDSRLEYIHALDIFMRNKVTKRFRYNNNIYAMADNYSTSIRFNNGKIVRYTCVCNRLCKHILATLIAFEKEADTFITKNDRMNKIIDAYKRLVKNIKYNSLEEDIGLINDLHTLIITSRHNNISQHIISLLMISILINIDNKYEANTIQIVNEKVADSINSIIDAISVKEQVEKNARSWDNIITELMEKVD